MSDEYILMMTYDGPEHKNGPRFGESVYAQEIDATELRLVRGIAKATTYPTANHAIVAAEMDHHRPRRRWTAVPRTARSIL